MNAEEWNKKEDLLQEQGKSSYTEYDIEQNELYPKSKYNV